MIRNYLDKKGFEFKQGSVKKTFGIQVSMISEGIDSGAVYFIINVIGNEYNRILADELFENCAEDMKGEETDEVPADKHTKGECGIHLAGVYGWKQD